MEILEILSTIDAENKDLINNINNYYLDKLYSSTKKESIVSTKEEFSHMQKNMLNILKSKDSQEILNLN